MRMTALDLSPTHSPASSGACMLLLLPPAAHAGRGAGARTGACQAAPHAPGAEPGAALGLQLLAPCRSLDRRCCVVHGVLDRECWFAFKRWESSMCVALCSCGPGTAGDGGHRRRAAGGEGAEDVTSVVQLAECAPPPIAPPAPAGAAGESAGPGQAAGQEEAAAAAPESLAEPQPGRGAVSGAHGGAAVTRLVPLRVGAARGLRGLRGVQVLAASADGALCIWHSNGGCTRDAPCLLSHMRVHCTPVVAKLPWGVVEGEGFANSPAPCLADPGTLQCLRYACIITLALQARFARRPPARPARWQPGRRPSVRRCSPSAAWRTCTRALGAPAPRLPCSIWAARASALRASSRRRSRRTWAATLCPRRRGLARCCDV